MTKKQPAGIQYLGESGLTESCKQAVIKLIHFGDKIEEVKILTAEGDHSNSHALLLTIDYGTQVAIKDGFSSGYPGEGPRGYAFVLNLLSQYTENIGEYITPINIFERLVKSCLTAQDIESIDNLKKVRPARWYDFVPYRKEDKPDVFYEFPLTIPMALIDHRLIEIALEFNSNPDNSILNAYRKIESIVRERTNLTHESSTKLFSKAFQSDESILYWKGLDSGESKGRASLFTSAFMAYRNNRAHQEPKHNLDNDIREFLLINQLFILEKEAIIREVATAE
ncbi:MAG: TIGR02391 family protein [Piscirickettsiaceae bacterium]|nr:TIGR02391 family protein [Piscirickettsiaceae bacterium]